MSLSLKGRFVVSFEIICLCDVVTTRVSMPLEHLLDNFDNDELWACWYDCPFRRVIVCTAILFVTCPWHDIGD